MSSRCLRSLLLVLPLLAIACGDDSDGRLAPQLTAPTVREVQPTAGPVAGNTLVNVYGSGFQDGARVFLGNLELQRTVVVNAFRIYGYTPTATSGRMDVRVLNPDGAYGLLVKGFTFEGPPSPTIAQAEVITGNSEAVSRGPPVGVTVRGAVTVPGVTRGVGQGGGVRAQVGFAPGDSDVLNAESYTWEDATYETDSGSGEADVYMGNVLLQAPIGGASREWVVSVRFSIDAGKTWVMADGDGSANGLSVAMTRRVFIARPRVDYCKLGPDGNNANPDLFYLPGDAASHKVAGQVYAADITRGAGGGSGLKAQLGYGPEDADPRDSSAWTWVDATYKAEHGDNDEWEATLPNPKRLGTYRVAFRFSISENAWRVCDADGTNDSTTGNLTFSLQKLGRLVVAATPPKPPVSWCKIGEDQTAPPAVSYITTKTDDLQTLYAQVHMPGVTDKPGAGEKLEGQIGWGPADEDPRESPQWNWSAQLEFNKDNFEVNDEWKGTLLNPGVAGTYRYAVRFRVDGGPLRVCDGNGTDDGGQEFEMEQLGQLTVTGPPVPPTVVGYCKLGPDGNTTPETVTYTTTATANRKVVAQVYVLGATPGSGVGAGVVGQLGYGPAGEDPTTSDQWNWTTNAAYKNDLFDNDEYDVTLPNPGTAGTYRFAYRFQVNGGAFLYCDSDGNGGDGTFDATKTGTLNVVAPPTTVGYCKLGPDGNTNPETVTYTPTMTADRKVVAQVHVAGVTPGAGVGVGVVGQLGWGPVGSDATTSNLWNWTTTAQFKNDLFDNDEYEATLPNPGTLGSFRFAYRFQVNGGAFLYCDSDGNTGAAGGFDAARMGTLTVSETGPTNSVGYCKLGPDGNNEPESVTYTTTSTANRKVVAQVFVEGVTSGTGVGAGVTAQLGWGPAGTDPNTSGQWSWSDAQFKGDLFSNDEYDATLPNPGTAGTYRFAYRFRANGGAYLYCDSDGNGGNGTFDVARMGTLTVAPPQGGPTTIGYCKLGPDGNNNPETVNYTPTATADRKVVAQVYVDGVTNGTGVGAGVVGQLGWGPVDTDPRTSNQWNWSTTAQFKNDLFNNDEYDATLPNPGAVGTYRFAYRFQVNGGDFLYCDSNGNGGNGTFDVARMGTLTVATTPPKPSVAWCKLGEDQTAPPAVSYVTTQTTGLQTIHAQVNVPGVTDRPGPGPALTGQLGWGPADADPVTSDRWNWSTQLEFNKDNFGVNDEWRATLPNPGVNGQYRYAVRFSVDGGPVRVCDGNGSDEGNPVELNQLGQLTVTGEPVPATVVGYCKLGPDGNTEPESVTYNSTAAADRKVVAQVFVAGVTNGTGVGAGIVGQLGLGPAGSDPRTSDQWNWSTSAQFKGDLSNNDEFDATLPNPGAAGTYRFAYRFQVNGGAFLYCDSDGNTGAAGGFDLARMGTLTVAIEQPRLPVAWCKLGEDQTAPPAVSYVTTQTTGLQTIHAQVNMPGVTDRPGAGPGLTGQLGWGPVDTDPQTSAQWNWSTQLEFNKDNFGVNDEWRATLPNPGVNGQYRYAVRFSVDGGPVRVCDGNGSDDGNPVELNQLGQLTVTGAPVPATVVGYCKLGPNESNEPESVTYLTTATGDRKVVAQVYVEGVTRDTGAGAGIVGQLGWGPVSSDPRTSNQWNWTTTAQFKNDIINNDEYEATLPNPGTVGSYRFAYRFRVNGGAYLYCDSDGNTGAAGGFDLARMGTLNVSNTPPATTIGYCKLGPDGNNNPETVTYTPTMTANRKVVAQVYVEGVTRDTGAGADVVGQLGWGPAGTDPITSSQWSWSTAQFKNDLFNNDEFDATLPNPGALGSYRFAYRFRVNGGAYLYCDSDGNTGAAGGFDLARMGTLNVATEQPRLPVTWCTLGEDQRAPEAITYLTGQSTDLKTVFAQVYMEGVTDRAGAGPGLVGQLGWGPVAEDPRTSAQWSWSTQLEFNKDNFGVNDEWRATLPNPGVNGQYRYAVRFSVNGGPIRVCDGNGTAEDNPFELNQLGQLTVTGEVVPPTVDYCKLGVDGNNVPESVTYTTTATADRKVVAQVYVQDVTPGTGRGVGVIGQLGWGPAGTDPTTSSQWSWSDAQYKNDLFNNDEYDATLPNPGVAGTYRFAYRFRANGGAFLYCDADGNTGAAGGFDAALTGTLTVEGPPVPPAVCRLVSVSGTTMGSGDAVTAVGTVRIPGVTDGTGPAANLQVQVGLGVADVNASTDPQLFSWKTTAYSRVAQAGTHEFTAEFHPSAVGNRMIGMRFSTNGSTWTYCDKDGSDMNGYTVGQQHALTVGNPSGPSILDYCKLQWPFRMSQTASNRDTYGRFYEAGVTNSTEANPEVVAELGYGPGVHDPGVSDEWTWIRGTFGGRVGDNNDNHEYRADLPATVPAGVHYVWRFRMGASGPYCFGDWQPGGDVPGGSSNGVSLEWLGLVEPAAP